MPKYKALKRFFGRKKQSQKAKPSIRLVNIRVEEPSRSSTLRSPTITADIGSVSAAGGAPAIVCDLGSARTRIGFANHRLPQEDRPSWVGLLPARHNQNPNNKYFSLGEEGLQSRDPSTLLRPIKKGRIVDLEALTFMLDDGFRRIGALTAEAEDLSGHNLLLALRPSRNQRAHETLFETLMETYRLDGAYFAFQQPLALFACGRMTGLVVDSGLGVTHAVPVFVGQAVKGATRTVKVGGDDVTDGLAVCLAQRFDFRVRSLGDRDALDRLKARLSMVSLVPGRPSDNLEAERFQLPDGRVAEAGDERYTCSEPLFNPHVIGESGVGVGAAVAQALRTLPSIEQAEMARNIIPVGGTCMLKGFDQRLQAELDRKYGGNAVVRRLASAAKRTTAWRGGAAWSRTPGFPNMLVTRAEFEEQGSRAYRRKCCLQFSLVRD